MASSVQDMRQQLDEILERARSDESFGQQLNERPESTLREAGLEGRAVGEVTGEIKRFQSGKGGREDYNKPQAQRACDFTTCWISWCDHWGTFRTS